MPIQTQSKVISRFAAARQNTAPPFTPSTFPVIHWASSEHRKATIEAISAGSPRRQLRAPFDASG